MTAQFFRLQVHTSPNRFRRPQKAALPVQHRNAGLNGRVCVKCTVPCSKSIWLSLVSYSEEAAGEDRVQPRRPCKRPKSAERTPGSPGEDLAHPPPQRRFISVCARGVVPPMFRRCSGFVPVLRVMIPRFSRVASALLRCSSHNYYSGIVFNVFC